MASRTVRLKASFHRAIERLKIVPGSERAIVVAGTIKVLSEAVELPTHACQRVFIPPVMKGYSRRVRALNLWLIYQTGDVLMLVTLVDSPPVPAF